jgi:hypothetical protein
MGMRNLLLPAIVTAACAFGHHSLDGTYNLEQRVTIQGQISKFLLRNPHSFLEVVTTAWNGQTQVWEVEWNPAGLLASRGIRADTLKAGDEVTITMSPAKIPGSDRGLLRIIRRPSDGFEWGTKPGEEPAEWGMPRK